MGAPTGKHRVSGGRRGGERVRGTAARGLEKETGPSPRGLAASKKLSLEDGRAKKGRLDEDREGGTRGKSPTLGATPGNIRSST